MEISRIGADAYMVYITNKELVSMRLTPASLRRGDVLRLLPEEVFSPRLVLYSGRGEVLIFVQGSSRAEYFAFATLEELIAAVSELKDMPSSLWLSEGRFVLKTERPSPLSDYAERAALREEYAKLLIDGDAIMRLRHLFTKNSFISH